MCPSSMTRTLQRLGGTAVQTILLAAALTQPALAAEPVKIGFLVKQPEESWFQDEWHYADQAAREKGFTLVKIGVPNGEKLISAIDNLAAQKAQGFVVCAPDVKLGTAIARAVKRNNLKVMSVDDQLVDGVGKPIADIPHMGISAVDIGHQVGDALLSTMKARHWNLAEVGAIRVTYDQLPTARARTEGAGETLVAAGFPKANLFDAPESKTDTESAFNAANIVFTKQARFKRWIIFSTNDEGVMGGVRAAESRGFGADSVIAIGIGGSKTAQNEFAKPVPTGFYGSILLSPKRHGYETSLAMYKWITENQAPPALTLTTGVLVTRDNQAQVRAGLGL